MFDAEEDAADVRAYDEAKAALEAGRESILPADVCKAIMGGDTRLAAIRKWRGAERGEVAARAGLGEEALCDIELGKVSGDIDALAKIARALDVPVHWIS